ncbi:unnamed protein product, partial [Dracunculus medinensis]|uniref:Histone-lysine N-methyltransferase SETMAR n=1 Tax=Dracunculus medinensis TaxID=318479 RepID=A0A0N4UK36_DRAME
YKLESENILEFRKLVCLTKDRSFKYGSEVAKCHLVLKDEEDEPGRRASDNTGCFKKRFNASVERVYCDIFCPGAYEVFHSAFDLFHKSCFQYHNYQLSEQNENWSKFIFY